MARKFLYDLEKLDPKEVQFGIEEIRRVNPQRHEFEQLTAIVKLLPEEEIVVGYRDISPDEFWVRGHVPGNPIFPGVLMLEAAAQLCSFYYANHFTDDERFFGFGGIDRVRFRSTVLSGDRLYLIAKVLRLSRRVSVFAAQGVVKGKIAFEAEIIGMSLSS